MSFGCTVSVISGESFSTTPSRIFAMKAQSPFTAANGVPAALGQSLHDSHPAFDTISTGALSFTIDIKNGSTVDVDHVPTGKNDILVRLLAKVESGNIDHLAEGLPVPRCR